MTTVQSAKTFVREAGDTIWRHRIVVVALATVLIWAAVPLVNSIPKQYSAGANVLVVNGNTRDDPTFSSPDLPSIATSTVVLERMAKRLHLDIPLLQIKRHVTVKPAPYKSSIMRIEYMDADPDRAAAIANGVADDLIGYYNQISTARYDADLRALNAELTKQSQRIRTIDSQVKSHGYVPVSSGDEKGNDTFAVQLNALETDRALTSATMQGDASHLQSLGLDAQTRAKLLRRDVLRNDERYRDLLNAASVNAVLLANERSVYTGHFPGLPALESKVRSLDSAAEREAQRALSSPDSFSTTVASAAAEQRKAVAVVAADRAKLAALDGLIESEHSRLNALAPLSLLRLQRSAAQAEYLSISSHRAIALANRADALSLGSVSVVDRAISSEVQTGPSRKSFFAILILLSLAVACASAFIIDALNPRLRRLNQIENLYGRQVIATLGKK